MNTPLAPMPLHSPMAFPMAPGFEADNLAAQERKLALLEFWRSVVKRKWAVLGLGAAVGVVAFVVAHALTPIYQASATLLIEPTKAKILSIEEVYGGGNQQRENLQTQIEILKSRDVMERTVRALKLWENPRLDPRLSKPSWRMRAMATLGLGTVVTKTDWKEPELVDAVTGQLMSGLTIVPVRNSQLVQVKFSSDSRELAATVVNALMAQYVDADRAERYRMTTQVSQQLMERLVALRGKVSESEQALQTYREKRGLVSLAGNSQGVAGQQVGALAERLTEARSRRLALEGVYQQAKSASDLDLDAIPGALKDPALMDLIKQANTARAKLAELTATLSGEHYRIKQAEAELAGVNALLNKQRRFLVTSIAKEYELARTNEQALERAVEGARGAVQDMNRGEFQLGVLEREYQANRQLYEMLMNRAKETNLAADVQALTARVIDKAMLPGAPIMPDKTAIVLRAMLVALLLGALACVVLDKLDNTIKGGDDAEIRLKQPVLAVLPEVPKTSRAKMAKAFLDDPHSHYAEGIRTARTGVLLSNLDIEHRILLITSTLPGEGKTTVAINLALAHAQTKKTLLIDGDMRRSQVARSLKIAPGGKGLTNLVSGDATLKECVYLVPGTELEVMPVGDTPPNPLELLLSNRFKETLRQLSAQYEMVIIDSPPVELVSEALVLAPMATSVAFVVKAMGTPTPLVRKSLARLTRAGGSILGVVVNKLDFEHAQRYYGEYGSSSYNYGGYGYAPYLHGSKRNKALPDSSFGGERNAG